MNLNDDDMERLLCRFKFDEQKPTVSNEQTATIAEDAKLQAAILEETSRLLKRRRHNSWIPSFVAAAMLLVGIGIGWFLRPISMYQTSNVMDIVGTESSKNSSETDSQIDPNGDATKRIAQPIKQIASSKVSPTNGNESELDSNSPDALEQMAELAETRAESAKFYRSAGDAFLKQNNVPEAIRCYRLHLRAKENNQLALADGDSWLLMSLKSGMSKGN